MELLGRVGWFGSLRIVIADRMDAYAGFDIVGDDQLPCVPSTTG